MSRSISLPEDEPDAEPLLKYQRIGFDVADKILKEDAVSCIRAHEKLLVIGTQNGFVFVFDLTGNEIKRFYSHTFPVNDVSVDAGGEIVISCSDDGLVVVNAIFETENPKAEFSCGGQQMVQAIAIDPDYVRRDTSELVMGGADGKLMLKQRGWFGKRMTDTMLHSDEGAIHAVRWEGRFIAWANQIGVKVYDCTLKQRITHIARPPASLEVSAGGGGSSAQHRCHLCWADSHTLLIGWASSIQAVEVREREASQAKLGLPPNYVAVVAQFTADDFICCGIAPYGQDIAVLCHVIDGGEGTDDEGSEEGVPQRPELRILSRNNEEQACDALTLHGFDQCDPSSLHLDFIESASERLFYVASPDDVIVARPRDANDHIHWLLEQHQEKEALKAAQTAFRSKSMSEERVKQVGNMYVHRLTEQGKFHDAAIQCHELFHEEDATFWDRWIFVFAQAGELATIATFVPINKPRLRQEVYEMVLGGYLRAESSQNDHTEFLQLLQRWPPGVYNVRAVIQAVLGLFRTVESSVLAEALALLYEHDSKHPKSLDIYLYLQRSVGEHVGRTTRVTTEKIFDFIERHNLYSHSAKRAAAIVELDPRRGVELLLQHATRDTRDLHDIVEQLKPQPELLHKYLRGLFDFGDGKGTHGLDAAAGYKTLPRGYHDMQVELFADHERERLQEFLRDSTYYDPHAALTYCRKKGCNEEVVFLLGRAKKYKEALSMILDDLQDIDLAIRFVKERGDEDDGQLWESLITRGVENPTFVSKLLANVGSHINPLHVIDRIPDRMEITGLRDKLVKIISDYKTMQRLSTGCSKILRSDCVGLCGKHVREKRRACTFSPEDYTQAPSERLGASTASRSAMYFGAGAKGDLDEGEEGGATPESASPRQNHGRAARDRDTSLPAGGRGAAEAHLCDQKTSRIFIMISTESATEDLAQLERCFGVAEGGFEELRHGLPRLEVPEDVTEQDAVNRELARLSGWDGMVQSVGGEGSADTGLAAAPAIDDDLGAGTLGDEDDLLSLERTATWDAVAQADALLARTRQKLDAPVKRKSGGSADLLSPKDIEAKYSSRAV